MKVRTQRKLTGSYTGSITCLWSSVNQAWLVLFGPGRIDEKTLLRIISDRAECADYLFNELNVERL